MKKGFDFTLMVVGEAGLGKSTLINSLFLMDLYEERKIPTVEGELFRIPLSCPPVALPANARAKP